MGEEVSHDLSRPRVVRCRHGARRASRCSVQCRRVDRRSSRPAAHKGSRNDWRVPGPGCAKDRIVDSRANIRQRVMSSMSDMSGVSLPRIVRYVTRTYARGVGSSVRGCCLTGTFFFSAPIVRRSISLRRRCNSFIKFRNRFASGQVSRMTRLKAFAREPCERPTISRMHRACRAVRLGRVPVASSHAIDRFITKVRSASRLAKFLRSSGA